MVRLLLSAIMLITVVFVTNGQSLNIGLGVNQPLQRYSVTPETHYLSFWNYSFILDLDETVDRVYPVLYVSYQAKNRFFLKNEIGLVRTINVIKKESGYSLHQDEYFEEKFAVKIITLDERLQVGYTLVAHSVIQIIPYMGVLAKCMLSIEDRRYSGGKGVSNESFVNENWINYPITEGYLVNQSMDFKPLIIYGSAGVLFKWYNYYLGINYDQNISSIDNRGFYKSANQLTISLGIDLLSIYLTKRQ
ncbi:hypothetical protein SAMN04488029_0867 [Reichenbachiella faecimaris]|uniref:Outer membrane protein beta-barrel domain-containing protein n=1 Tax=Reichenbachiella faecimaris TaxID=692418 RepID=A0A1W2G7W6_REIFA|nr:hypothetical protein [Reichenbachiella faecimaris]SMD32522.1 hypothetical protein SAMN04488029_0867 [Reichenbachiella faecimaris]